MIEVICAPVLVGAVIVPLQSKQLIKASVPCLVAKIFSLVWSVTIDGVWIGN
jgi:hypothetical protein